MKGSHQNNEQQLTLTFTPAVTRSLILHVSGGGRKAENPEGTHADSGRTCQYCIKYLLIFRFALPVDISVSDYIKYSHLSGFKINLAHSKSVLLYDSSKGIF